MIREVQPSDIEAITSIYNYYIENSVITFEEESISSEEMNHRVNTVVQNYPWLVYELDGVIAGYAYASKFKERSAYKFTTETTIYLDKNAQGKGIGYNLYSELIKRLKNSDLKMAMGAIALPNPGSKKLHEKLGFKKVAHFSKVGYKFNKWIDVGYWELMLH